MSDPTLSWMGVADTAVKIGMGAAVSGLFGWLIARHTARSAITKLIFERRSEKLLLVAQQYEAFFQAYLQFTNCLAGLVAASASARNIDPTGAVYPHMLEQETTQATALKGDMTVKMEQSFFAQSMLMMLGEDTCRDAAEKLHLAIADANHKLKFDGASVDLSHLSQCHAAVASARKMFYREMSKAFTKI